MRGIRTTSELEAELREEVGVEGSGSWDAITGAEPLTLKKFTMHDDRVTLKFTNGTKARIFHAELPDRIDGDLWDVSEIGWV